MIASLAVGRGGHYAVGRAIGATTAPCVRANVAAFWRALEPVGRSPRWWRGKAAEEAGLLPAGWLEEIAGLADSSGLALCDVLAYNLYGDRVFPDECTVMMAVASAGQNGKTLFLKNSDQVGSDAMVGSGFEQHKEIYVIQVIVPEQGNRILGVTAAGRAGIKMGLNDKGVAAGSNIARTLELRERRVDITQVRASDRTQLMRQGLEKDSALAAAQRVSGLLLENPTSTPGNIEFADAQQAVIIEGAYTEQAMEVVRDRVAARANRFQVLEDTNDPSDVSSVCRYQRATHLLGQSAGQLTVEHFIGFSQDHANGPGPNSICRHDADYHEETSLGAAVIEIDPAAPEQSTITIALGKPCHAWQSPQGYVRLRAADAGQLPPAGFLDGSVWRQHYSEEPYRA